VGALDTRRNNTRRDHRCLEQPEIVAGKIEYLREGGDVRTRRQVNADQPQQRLIDDAQIRLHRRRWAAAAPTHGQVD